MVTACQVAVKILIAVSVTAFQSDHARGRIFDHTEVGDTPVPPASGVLACEDRGVGSPDSSFRRLLIESLTLLAAGAAAQVAWLDEHDVVADEIALDFDHAFRMAEHLVAARSHRNDCIDASRAATDGYRPRSAAHRVSGYEWDP
ncbi:hypothetical protein [Streptomyces sp. NPDC059909]|uniref:hypothetical protein n=1 Tax=Streptomyces sp. NPDC059909 TaxID=3346998 RepID=UPI00364ADEFD